MQVLEEKPRTKERTSLVAIAPVRRGQRTSAPVDGVSGNSQTLPVLTAGRSTMVKIADGIARLG